VRLTAELDTNIALGKEADKQLAEAEAKAKQFEADKRDDLKRELAVSMRIVEALAKAVKEQHKEPKPPDRTRIQNLRDQLFKLQHDKESLARDMAGFVDQVAALKNSICYACGQPVKNAQKKLRVAQASLDNVKAVFADMEDKFNNTDSTLARAIADIQGAAEKYDVDKKSYDERAKIITTLTAGRNMQEKVLRDIKVRENVYAEIVRKARARITELRGKEDDIRAKLDEATKYATECKFWNGAFKEIRMGVIDDTLAELEMTVSRHAGMLGLSDWGIRFETERETKRGVSYGFQVYLYPPDMDEPVKWESYSGGESQRWQLAVAPGLSEVLLARAGVSPNIEIYDEPTRGMSAEGIEDLLEHLRTRALEFGRVLYLCDHHSLHRGAFDGILEVVKEKTGVTIQWLD
jgi:DNA repair exonuclease SbcCD ATPase subunit